MSIVYIGSAHGDENGAAYGGQAGDQTGRELSSERWYKHKKGWRVFRARDPEKRVKIAEAMKSACDNPYIGYDQYQRWSLRTQVKDRGFDPLMAAQPCETDCSALVWVCCAHAGIIIPDYKSFNTYTEPQMLMDTGEFEELPGTDFTDSPDRLMIGDILVTAVRGHTVVVLNDGDRASADKPDGHPTLKRGATGKDVKRLQRLLMNYGCGLHQWGADGDFGAETERTVKCFQAAHDLEVDGVVGEKTWDTLEKAVENA